MSAGSDEISTLPINKNFKAKPSDLELIHNFFRPQNIPIITNGINSFKFAVVATILFFILSLPVSSTLINVWTHNAIFTKLILVSIFFVVFYILQKFVFKV